MVLFFLICCCVPILNLLIFYKKSAIYNLSSSLFFSILLFNLSLYFLIMFDTFSFTYQFTYMIKFGEFFNEIEEVVFAIDSLSIWFILLTSFLLPPSILYSFTFCLDKNLNLYLLLIFFLNFILISFFLTTNLLLFYIFFELALIPVFLLIILWGSKSRKILASLYFFIYTFFGSLFFLFAIFTLYSVTGSLNFIVLLNYIYSSSLQNVLWPCMAFAMAVKIPMMPFHLWLPEAHVEAPTIGSVYLASLLLKLGSYGFLRLVLPIFPYATKFYTPLIQTLALLSVIYCSFIIIRQIDLKKIIAYSSIIHMNFALFGLFTFNIIALQGSVLLAFAHGLTSGALFLLVGMLYDRYKTKILFYYSGLTLIMPIFAFIFLFFSFCNIGFPGTLNFSSELLLFIGIINYAFTTKTLFIVIFISIGLFSSVLYSIWLVNRTLFGNLKIYNSITFIDLTDREILTLLPFIIYVIFFGLNSFILGYTQLFLRYLLVYFMV